MCVFALFRIMKVLVASENIVKINAVKEAFDRFYDSVEVIGIGVPSDVSEQPIGNETYDGAKNRVLNLIAFAEKKHPDADMFAAIEGGVQKLNGKWFVFGAVCISDGKGKFASGLSPHFEIPPKIIEPLLEGKELGEIIDELSCDENTKRKGGAIGFLTKESYGRKDLYVNGVIMALVPFLNKEIYFENESR